MGDSYYDSLSSLYGCDSIYMLKLNVDTVDLRVTQNQSVLTSEAQNALYQWLDCDNGFAEIPGENTAVFEALVDGNYAVFVTQNNCADTSSCYNISGIYVKNIYNAEGLKLYPNPNDGNFVIELFEKTLITIYNLLGQSVFLENMPEGQHIFKLKDRLPLGMYILRAENNKHYQAVKIIIQ